MKSLSKYKAEQMKDEEFRAEYENMQPEFDLIRAIVDARNERHLTQKELAEITGINQADISKIENGTRNPSLNMLKRLAEGMGTKLELKFVPINSDTKIAN
jgi:transcriptional regulator with XRE-family HTH domain